MMEEWLDAFYDRRHERVGILFGMRDVVGEGQVVRVREWWRCRNLAKDRRDSYIIGRGQWAEGHRRAQALGLVVVGYVHNHPATEATPSDEDYASVRERPANLIVTPGGEWCWWNKAGILARGRQEGWMPGAGVERGGASEEGRLR